MSTKIYLTEFIPDNRYAKRIPGYLSNIDEATGKLGLSYLHKGHSASRKKQRPIANTVPNL